MEKELQKKNSTRRNYGCYSIKVRLKGLEPPRREAPDPKSGVATNYTTGAFSLNGTAKISKFCGLQNQSNSLP
jgi:hypothetical protein